MYDASNFTTPLDVFFTLGNLIFQCFIVLMLLPSLIFQNFLEALLSAIIKFKKRLIEILQILCDILLFGQDFSDKSLQNLSESTFPKALSKRLCTFDNSKNLMKSSKFESNRSKSSNVEKKRCKNCLCSLATNNSFVYGKDNNKSQFPNASNYTRNNIGTQTTRNKNAFTQYEEHLTPCRLYSNTSVQNKNSTESSKDFPIFLNVDSLESSMSLYEIDLGRDSSDENVEPCKSLQTESLNLKVTKLDTPSNSFDASATNQSVINETLETPISRTSFRPFESVLLRFSEETVIPTSSPEEYSFFKKGWRKVSKLSCFEKLENSNKKRRLSTIFGKRFTSTENNDIVFERNEIFSEISSCCLNIFHGLKSKVKRQNNFGSVAFKRF